MTSPLTFVTLALLLALLLAHPRPVHAQDPTCRRGIRSRDGRACCRSSCGKCGGGGCYQRSVQHSTRCCDRAIRLNERSCRVTGAPCVISGGGSSPTASPRPAYDTRRGRWRHAEVKAGWLVNRHEACAVMVGGLLVMVGGRGDDKAVSIYDPKKKEWTNHPGAGRGVSIHHMQCAVAAGKVWIIASWKGDFPYEKNNDRIFIYDVASKTWSTKPGMPANRNRGGAAVVKRGNIMYVVGGNRGGHGSHATSLTWMDAYNWRTGVWLKARFPNMPGKGRDHVGGAMVKGQLCVSGGRDGGVGDFFNAVDVSTYCYNFGTRSWSKRGDLGQGRAGAMTGTACDGRMMIAGGEGSGKAFRDVEVFDGQKWEKAPSMVSGRHGSGLGITNCATCGHIFVPSGSGALGGSPELSTTEEMIPRGAKWGCSRF